jgi:DNA repair protein RecO (recombination protein O)
MEWRDEGILLWVRRHGESNVIVEALTAEHGRHAGLVRGGTGKAQSGILQAGSQLSLEWKARLAEHLGSYKVDLIRSRASAIMSDRGALACLNTISAMLVQFLPEREPNPEIYAATLELMDELGTANPQWPVSYARWELGMLNVLGFGLDLSSCASTGQREDLVYVSPRSGRAVCRAAGGPFADRMLPLPQFLLGGRVSAMADVREALRLTGYFFDNWVCPAFEVERVPEARGRLLRVLEKTELATAEGPDEFELDADEQEWLRKLEQGG